MELCLIEFICVLCGRHNCLKCEGNRVGHDVPRRCICIRTDRVLLNCTYEPGRHVLRFVQWEKRFVLTVCLPTPNAYP